MLGDAQYDAHHHIAAAVAIQYTWGTARRSSPSGLRASHTLKSVMHAAMTSIWEHRDNFSCMLVSYWVAFCLMIRVDLHVHQSMNGTTKENNKDGSVLVPGIASETSKRKVSHKTHGHFVSRCASTPSSYYHVCGLTKPNERATCRRLCRTWFRYAVYW